MKKSTYRIKFEMLLCIFMLRILNLDGNSMETLEKSAFGKLPVVSGMYIVRVQYARRSSVVDSKRTGIGSDPASKFLNILRDLFETHNKSN